MLLLVLQRCFSRTELSLGLLWPCTCLWEDSYSVCYLIISLFNLLEKKIWVDFSGSRSSSFSSFFRPKIFLEEKLDSLLPVKAVDVIFCCNEISLNCIDNFSWQEEDDVPCFGHFCFPWSGDLLTASWDSFSWESNMKAVQEEIAVSSENKGVPLAVVVVVKLESQQNAAPKGNGIVESQQNWSEV